MNNLIQDGTHLGRCLFQYRLEHGALNRVGTSLEIEVADEFILCV